MPSIKPRPYPLDYAIWSILENKTNATSHPNIGSLKTIEEEWNKKCLEKLFWKHANRFEDIKNFKNGEHIR